MVWIWRKLKRRRVTIACVLLTFMVYAVINILFQLDISKAKDIRRSNIKRSRVYTKVPSTDIYIFSVIGINTTDNSQWDVFAVNTWFYYYANQSIWCCYLLNNGSIIIEKSRNVHQRTDMFNQIAQIECPNLHSGIWTSRLNGVSLTTNHHCASESSAYVEPVLPLKPLDKFNMAICAKIAYGQLDLEMTIEWMEYYILMGVSHVLIYRHQLSDAAFRVLLHYRQTGFLEILEFDFPSPDNPRRRVGDKNTDAWNDEQVVVYDCQTRLRGYNYVGIVDLDEFIVPVRDRNFPEMIGRLMRLIPNAASIEFYGEVFVLDWGKTNPSGELTITQYLNRTVSEKPININQRKLIHIPSRVERGSVVTHGCKLLDSSTFVIWKDPLSIVTMNHYRRCVSFVDDCLTRMRTTDTRITRHARKIAKSVLKTREIISKQCPVCLFN